MIIITKSTICETQIAAIRQRARQFDCESLVSQGSNGTFICLFGNTKRVPANGFDEFNDIETIRSVSKPYPLISREFQSTDTVIDIQGIPVGGQQIQVIAGPCSVESPEQMTQAALDAVTSGASFLRGGAFKPRTSPYSFQGHGELGLKYLTEAARVQQLPVVTELMDVRDIDLFVEYGVDVIQIGARNMQNFNLLKEVGKLDIPVVLKRGMSATVKDWLMAAEYIAAGGNLKIIFAERGIRTYENAYRNTLDISAIPFVKQETHLPVIVDPSHAGGTAWMVPALSFAAIAAGADGLLIESHPNPAKAWSDGPQCLTAAELKNLIAELDLVAQARGRYLVTPPTTLPAAFKKFPSQPFAA